MDLRLKPKKDCKFCNGEGWVQNPYDTEDDLIMSDYCECILNQVPEDYWDSDSLIVVDEPA